MIGESPRFPVALSISCVAFGRGLEARSRRHARDHERTKPPVQRRVRGLEVEVSGRVARSVRRKREQGSTCPRAHDAYALGVVSSSARYSPDETRRTR